MPEEKNYTISSGAPSHFPTTEESAKALEAAVEKGPDGIFRVIEEKDKEFVIEHSPLG